MNDEKRILELRSVALGLEEAIAEKRRAIAELRKRGKKKKVQARKSLRDIEHDEVQLLSSSALTHCAVSARDVMAAVEGVYLVLGRDPRKTLTSWARGVLVRRRKKRCVEALYRIRRRIVQTLLPEPKIKKIQVKAHDLRYSFKAWKLHASRIYKIDQQNDYDSINDDFTENDFFFAALEKRSFLDKMTRYTVPRRRILLPSRAEEEAKNEKKFLSLTIPTQYGPSPRLWLTRFVFKHFSAWRQLAIQRRAKRYALIQCWRSFSRRWRLLAFATWQRQAAADTITSMLTNTIRTTWSRTRLAAVISDWRLMQSSYGSSDNQKHVIQNLRNESKLLRAHLRELAYLSEHHVLASNDLEDVTQRWQKRSLGEPPTTAAISNNSLIDLARRLDDAKYILHLFPPATFPSTPEESQPQNDADLTQQDDTRTETNDLTEAATIHSNEQNEQVQQDDAQPQDAALTEPPLSLPQLPTEEELESTRLETMNIDVASETNSDIDRDDLNNVPPIAARLLSVVRKREAAAPIATSTTVSGIPLFALANTLVHELTTQSTEDNKSLFSVLDTVASQYRQRIVDDSLEVDKEYGDKISTKETPTTSIISLLRKELADSDTPQESSRLWLRFALDVFEVARNAASSSSSMMKHTSSTMLS